MPLKTVASLPSVITSSTFISNLEQKSTSSIALFWWEGKRGGGGGSVFVAVFKLWHHLGCEEMALKNRRPSPTLRSKSSFHVLLEWWRWLFAVVQYPGRADVIGGDVSFASICIGRQQGDVQLFGVRVLCPLSLKFCNRWDHHHHHHHHHQKCNEISR